MPGSRRSAAISATSLAPGRPAAPKPPARRWRSGGHDGNPAEAPNQRGLGRYPFLPIRRQRQLAPESQNRAQARPSISLVSWVIRLGCTLAGSPGIFDSPADRASGAAVLASPNSRSSRAYISNAVSMLRGFIS